MMGDIAPPQHPRRYPPVPLPKRIEGLLKLKDEATRNFAPHERNAMRASPAFKELNLALSHCHKGDMSRRSNWESWMQDPECEDKKAKFIRSHNLYGLCVMRHACPAQYKKFELCMTIGQRREMVEQDSCTHAFQRMENCLCRLVASALEAADTAPENIVARELMRSDDGIPY